MRPFRSMICVSLLSFAPFSLLFAQQIEIGASLGGASYLGDLNPYNPIKISGLGGGMFIKTNLNPHWSIGLYFHAGSIKAADADSDNEQLRDRNLSFKTSLKEISAQVEFNLFDLYAYNRKGRITPYLFTGIGGLIFKPTAIYNEDKYELREYRTEGQADPYSKYVLTFPYGVGVKYKMKNNWSIFSQVGYRTPLTDFIDDVSGRYAPATAWTGSSAAISQALSDRSGENTGLYLGETGTQRGDFRKRDTYMFVGIGISYTFVSQKCFTF